MNGVLATRKWPVVAATLAVLPFALLELINRPEVRASLRDFPVTLFAGLWLMALLFAVVLQWFASGGRAAGPTWASAVIRVLGALLLIFIAVAWFNTLADQMPCFLGVPNCD